MSGKYKFKSSRMAVWALWLARLTIPVAIISFLLMRFGGMHPSIAVYCFGAAIALSFLSILASLVAFPAIWFEGYRGGQRLWGTFLRSLIIILPALTLAYFYFSRPAFSDLSTNPVEPPEFSAAWTYRHDSDNSLDVGSLEVREKQALAYPDLESLYIDHSSELVYLVVEDELKKAKWDIIRQTDQRDSIDGALFEAHTRSLVTGLHYVMAIRLIPDSEFATIVDMRSASLWGPHDLGLNARRIQGFFASVQERLEQGVQHFELQLEEIKRQRRLEQGPLPRPKPKRRPDATVRTG
ncbi:DUF1499 domain-containing protein [Cohaesibacter sp. CAU 1516]|uniref:DUF1499 domain-containing protein n=1 Tax=Cohaesibacter sp. CAU 1516 TaxID=2576038 RepID=UPI001484DADB|nr:DUF1499 domain-containing protein [Cohaesibacter sp. CAU 1516]